MGENNKQKLKRNARKNPAVKLLEDKGNKAFAKEARRQSLLAAKSKAGKEDADFWESIADTTEWK